ncbi:MAG: response regulator, partial [Gammaproteobacteria bacterium]|nr:response regulator [Gammaproteobacteria bacterium]
MSPQRALVVDDDPTNRIFLRALLEKEGYQVIVAEHGAQAIECFRTEVPEIIFMDVMMPVMNGYEATRRIKALAGDYFIPVIFLTALTDDEALARCIEAGGDDFLTKPYKQATLQSKIAAMRRIAVLQRSLRS